MNLDCFISGIPAPQGSKKAFRVGNSVRIVESSNKLQPWRTHCINSLAAYKAQCVYFDTAIEVSLVFFFQRPKTHSKKQRLSPWKTTAPDVDKLCRGVFDALTQASVISDDAIITRARIVKVYASEGGDTGVHITIKPLVDLPTNDLPIPANPAEIGSKEVQNEA